MKNYNLISYAPLLKRKDIMFKVIEKVLSISDYVFIDCGAFSLFNRKQITGHFKEITIQNYIKFCKQVENKGYKNIRYIHFDFLDCTDSQYIEKSNKNYDIMIRAGLNPIPVFRVHDTFKRLDDWLTNGCDIICIAGLASKEKAFKTYYIKALKKRFGDLCSHFHLLGYSNTQGLKYVKPYSADSSVWSNARVYYDKKNTFQFKRKDGKIDSRKQGFAIKIMSIKNRIDKKVWSDLDSILFDNKHGVFVSKDPTIQLRYLSIITALKTIAQRKIIQSFGVKPFFVSGNEIVLTCLVNKDFSRVAKKISLKKCYEIEKIA